MRSSEEYGPEKGLKNAYRCLRQRMGRNQSSEHLARGQRKRMGLGNQFEEGSILVEERREKQDQKCHPNSRILKEGRRGELLNEKRKTQLERKRRSAKT